MKSGSESIRIWNLDPKLDQNQPKTRFLLILEKSELYKKLDFDQFL